ncbi:WYL domain-containing protein [Mucilaginibacter ginsenosidivorans]|uniref:WYL domain-containing protein n=1 Tax=Mucilaginibacter ginsenosidivorans TaxID=398053 RepID=A0A5B8URZ0_9SPHI|nr:WYL domain-containing protein [Mucilaginibacter ginsenosidivorans]QEC61719.1 WYL domain-containing protein [Mucilaginibacter ginsenosidivorans]
MDTEVINLGDIITLTSHAYLNDLTSIVISGEPQFLPPLFAVVEIYKVQGEEGSPDSFEYKCIWFATKLQTFEYVRFKHIYVRKLTVDNSNLLVDELQPGAMVTLKTMDYELSKRKASLSLEDNTLHSGASNTTINALLTHLSPVMHVLSIKDHKSKHPKNKIEHEEPEQAEIRHPSKDVMCFWYNSLKEKFSEIVIPIEALKLVNPINPTLLDLINEVINSAFCLRVINQEQIYLVKPKLITYRSGYYFLRGYDYVLNRITELSIDNNSKYEKIEKFVLHSAPEFNLEQDPNSLSKDAALVDIEKKISNASTNHNYIRIKYKNRNDILSIRTIKEYKILLGREDGADYKYLQGFCCLRMAERVFRLDRIDNVEELDLKFE